MRLNKSSLSKAGHFDGPERVSRWSPGYAWNGMLHICGDQPGHIRPQRGLSLGEPTSPLGGLG